MIIAYRVAHLAGRDSLLRLRVHYVFCAFAGPAIIFHRLCIAGESEIRPAVVSDDEEEEEEEERPRPPPGKIAQKIVGLVSDLAQV